MSGSEWITIATIAAMTTTLMSLLSISRTVLVLVLSENFSHHADRARQRRAHLIRKPDSGAQVGGFAGHHQAAAGMTAHRVEHREDRVRCEVVRVHHRRAGGDFGGFHLQHGDRAGLAAALRGVHEHEQVAPVEQFVDQVNTADAEVGDLHAVWHRTLRQQPDHLHAEGVISLEDVADPGDQYPPRHRAPPGPGAPGAPGLSHGSTSSGAK
jgi:hypothetical protein